MTQFEKAEIRRLPKKYRPMGAWGFFWHSFLYAIPVLGWICLIWGAVNDRNICRRGYARMYLLSFLIALIFVGVAVALILTGVVQADVLDGVLDSIKGNKTT